MLKLAKWFTNILLLITFFSIWWFVRFLSVNVMSTYTHSSAYMDKLYIYIYIYIYLTSISTYIFIKPNFIHNIENKKQFFFDIVWFSRHSREGLDLYFLTRLRGQHESKMDTQRTERKDKGTENGSYKLNVAVCLVVRREWALHQLQLGPKGV